MKQGDHYHLTGIGGVGMNALAQALAWSGCRVSGSDRDFDRGLTLPVFDRLSSLGIALHPQDGSALGPATCALVVSTAIEEDNAEVLAARRLSIPVLHRAEVLASVCEHRRCVAVAGTSGKSTVTGMTGWILAAAGLDPLVINGAPVLNWRDAETVGNVRSGQGNLCVVEVDESDRSLLRFFPEAAAITNASADHFDLDETNALFDAFARQVKGSIVDARDCPETYIASGPKLSSEGSTFSYEGVSFQLKVPGRHNMQNAIIAASLAAELGVSLSDSASALAGFRGIHRRLERVGCAKDITVFDDYSHNPDKIRAACQSIAPHFGNLHAVWRPHGYGPLKSLMQSLVTGFAESLGTGDSVGILPVYDAGGSADRSVCAGELVEHLASAGLDAYEAVSYSHAAECVLARASAGDAVLVMGARDPLLENLGREIVAAVVNCEL